MPYLNVNLEIRASEGGAGARSFVGELGIVWQPKRGERLVRIANRTRALVTSALCWSFLEMERTRCGLMPMHTVSSAYHRRISAAGYIHRP